MTVDIGDRTPLGLYVQDGRAIATHSMLKTFRRCPKQADFKYAQRLKPRMLGKPLKRGKWVHELLEIHHGGGDWLDHHRRLSYQFSQLFDEEREYYGDLPEEIEAIMRSYIWHYKNDPWKVHEVEFTVEANLPSGALYRGKVDALIENQFGLWLVDHKTHKTLPDHNFRLLDGQSLLYIWAAWEMGIPVLGFIWNYLRWKAPSIPPVVDLKRTPRLSRSVTDTDYPTYVRALKKYKEEVPGFVITDEYRRTAKRLQGLRYEFGKPQNSTFFRRNILEKSEAMIRKGVLEYDHTAERMNSYDFSEGAPVERVIDRGCSFMCSFTDLCTADLMGGNVRALRRQNFTVGDPNDYYQDRAGDVPDKE